jgi:hypothetical protein
MCIVDCCCCFVWSLQYPVYTLFAWTLTMWTPYRATSRSCTYYSLPTCRYSRTTFSLTHICFVCSPFRIQMWSKLVYIHTYTNLLSNLHISACALCHHSHTNKFFLYITGDDAQSCSYVCIYNIKREPYQLYMQCHPPPLYFMLSSQLLHYHCLLYRDPTAINQRTQHYSLKT